MNKLAVFVEGYTEVVFIEKLIEEIAGIKNVRIESKAIRGGTNAKRTIRTIKAAQPDTGQRFYVLIMDCGGDRQVKSRIIEEHDNLTKSDYIKIIGVRDVRPDFTYSEIPRLEANLPLYVKTSLIPVEFILGVMEIETWFLAETTHYSKIDPAITVTAIKATLGFDPENDNLELRPNPAVDLNNCYAIGGKSYEKNRIQDTTEVLDYLQVYMELNKKFKYIDRLVSSIDSFLA